MARKVLAPLFSELRGFLCDCCSPADLSDQLARITKKTINKLFGCVQTMVPRGPPLIVNVPFANQPTRRAAEASCLAHAISLAKWMVTLF